MFLCLKMQYASTKTVKKETKKREKSREKPIKQPKNLALNRKRMLKKID